MVVLAACRRFAASVSSAASLRCDAYMATRLVVRNVQCAMTSPFRQTLPSGGAGSR